MASQECKQGSKKHVGAIDDRFNRFSEISKDLKKAGLESSNLIIGMFITVYTTSFIIGSFIYMKIVGHKSIFI